MKFCKLLLALLMAPAIAYGPDRPQFPISLPEVVMVNGGCSGFVGFQSIVVTAAHCIEDKDAPQEIRFYDGMIARFAVIAIGDLDHRDFALLLGDTRGIKPAALADEQPRPEAQCFSVGHGGGNVAQMAIPCMVRGPLRSPWNRYLALHSNIIGGDSGSMVMTMDGRVFGIIVRSSFPVPIALAVDISYAREAYRAWLKAQGM